LLLPKNQAEPVKHLGQFWISTYPLSGSVFGQRQQPIEHWHEWIGDQTIADAMLDRLMQNHHRFTITGDSMRRQSAVQKAKATS